MRRAAALFAAPLFAAALTMGPVKADDPVVDEAAPEPAIVVVDEATVLDPAQLGALLFPDAVATAQGAPAAPPGALAAGGVYHAEPSAQPESVGGRRGLGPSRGVSVFRPPVFAPVTTPTTVAAAPAIDAVTGPAPVAIAVPVNFAFDSDELDASAKAVLDQIGAMLTLPQYQSKTLILEGHTDLIGAEDYNERLSLRRAVAAGRYLSQAFGLEPGRLMIEARGSAKPLPGYPGDHEVHRRVQFKAA